MLVTPWRWFIASLFVLVSSAGAAGNPIITIDHVKGDVTFSGYRLEFPVSALGETAVPLRHGDTLVVKAVETNPLLYSWTRKVEVVDLAQQQDLFKFLGTLRGPLVALGKVVVGTTMALEDPLTSYVGRLHSSSGSLATLISVAQELEILKGEVLQKSETKLEDKDLKWLRGPRKYESAPEGCAWDCANSREETIAVVSACLAQRAASVIGCWLEDRAQVPEMKRIATERVQQEKGRLQELQRARRNAEKAKDEAETEILEEEIAAQERRVAEADAISAALNAADAALPQAAVDLAAVFRRYQAFFESAARLLEDAGHQREVARISYRWNKKQKVTVSVTPIEANAKRVSLRPREFESVTFEVVPEWPLQTAIGAGFAHADGLTYPKYKLVEEEDARTLVIDEIEDRRFQFLPILSLSPRAWNRLGSWYADDAARATSGARHGLRSGSAFTFDLGWNAEDDDAAYTAGASMVFGRQFKIGGGVIWQQREVLDGVVPGPLAPDAEFATRDSFPPEWYVMISILGWPPFIGE